MKNYPNEIKLMVLIIVTFTFGVVTNQFLRPKNNQAFPFNETGVGSESAPVSILQEEFGAEYEIIMDAASRNSCAGDDLLILFAIRKAENGGPGFEFGVECQRGTDLDIQAGWAAATIMKNRKRWEESDGYNELFGVKGFIYFLGQRYCPLNTEVWVHNVSFWFDKFNIEIILVQILRNQTRTLKMIRGT
jgi:hypothetical protein